MRREGVHDDIARLRKRLATKLHMAWSFFDRAGDERARRSIAAEYLGEAQDCISALREIVEKEAL